MTDSQSHIVGTWTLNLCFSKGPVSFSRQVSSCLLFILLSVMLTPLSFFSLNPFNLLSFPFRFILLAPFRLLSSIYLSLLPWPLFICPPLAFPSCKMPPNPPQFTFLFSLSFTVSLSKIPHWFSLNIHKSFIHYLSPFPSLILKFHWCFFAFMSIPPLQFIIHLTDYWGCMC